MLGTELYSYFKKKIGYGYTGGLVTATANSLFKDALITGIEKKYRELLDQKEYDELTALLQTEKVYPVNGNAIRTAPIYISAMTYVTTGFPLYAITVTVTTVLPHNLSVGDSITTSGQTGITTSSPPNALVGTFDVVTVPSTTIFTFATTASVILGTYTANSDYVSAINDYWHLLTVKAKFEKDTYFTVDGASSTTPIKLHIEERTNLRTGELVTIAGVLGNTAANGDYYLKKLNQYQFALYSDKDFQSPVASSGIYTSGGTIARAYYNYCRVINSDGKVSAFNTPTVYFPQVIVSDNFLKFTPDDEEVTEITIDYIATPKDNLLIDVSDATVDLEWYYPVKFLYFVAEEAAEIYARRYRDQELYQQAKIAEQENK